MNFDRSHLSHEAIKEKMVANRMICIQGVYGVDVLKIEYYRVFTIEVVAIRFTT